MNLIKPLVLEGAKTERVELVPTKNFFKPVLVIVAPIAKEEAELLKADYLFDAAGRPRPFEGTHRIHGDFPLAHVAMVSTHLHHELASEKVARLGMFVVEKEGMSLRLRVHLPEGEDKLQELLHFLHQLNKSAFTVTVTDSQGTLPGAVPSEPIMDGKEDPDYKPLEADPETGLFNDKRATSRPFKNGKIEARLMYADCTDGYRSAWFIITKFKAGESYGGRMLSTQWPAFASESEAIEWAAVQIYTALQMAATDGKKEAGQKAEALEWIIDICPKVISLPPITEGDGEGGTVN